MVTREEEALTIVVWFEGSPAGRLALLHAKQIADAENAPVTVLTIAVRERVIGCGRCLQGTVLWNLEIEEIAREDLQQARRLLGASVEAEFEAMIGDPVEQIAATAMSRHATTIVLPWQRNRRLDPPHRRNVAKRLEANGNWQVVVDPDPGRHQPELLTAR